jgi:hypothetical protein
MRSQLFAAGIVLAAATACGGGGGDGAAAPGAPAPGAAAPAGAAKGHADPVQLTVDPCTLVTQDEAEKVMGFALAKGDTGINGTAVCTYVGNGAAGLISVSLEPPSLCKLLHLALDQNIFGGKQVRVDDIGDGGMQVVGNGNVQFTSHGGCIEVAGHTASGNLDDATVLAMARTAAGRVTG